MNKNAILITVHACEATHIFCEPKVAHSSLEVSVKSRGMSVALYLDTESTAAELYAKSPDLQAIVKAEKEELVRKSKLIAALEKRGFALRPIIVGSGFQEEKYGH